MSPDPRRVGNRLWRVETPVGPALQKVYRRRGRLLSGLTTALMTRLFRSKTSPFAAGRRRAEREALALWREVGIDVPRDLTDEVPGFGADDIVLLEFIPGESLLDLLRPGRLSAEARGDLLRKFAADWGRRHVIALERGDPRLVHEHGSFEHVILSGERLVNIDLERTYHSGDPRRLIAKEIVSLLRTLMKRGDKASFAIDLRAIVEAYPDHALLRWLVAEYAHSGSPWRRLLWGLDRKLRHRKGGRNRAKYAVVDRLATALEEVTHTSPSEGSARAVGQLRQYG